MSVSVPDICDDYADELQVLEPLFTHFGECRKFCGEVVTIKCFEDNSVVKQTLGGDGSGRVMVVDGGGSKRCALLGDMLAAMGSDNGWQGVIINGCVRDVEILATIPLGVMALVAHPMRSNKRGEGQLDVPVRFAGADIRPGQHLYADENGIVVVERKLDLEF